MNHFNLVLDFWARAGGAGGGHFSGGGGFGGGRGGGGGGGFGSSGDDNFIFYLLLRLMAGGPIGWLVLAVIAYLVFKFFIQNSTELSDPDFVAPPDAASPSAAPYVPQINEVALDVLEGQPVAEFQNKVANAFSTIQSAWSQQRVDMMRRFISDGVYQRFHAQFTMMNLLSQSNLISNVHIHDIRMVKTSMEGGYQSIDVQIEASSTDQFVSAKFPQLNTAGGVENFVEFWTFIRRVDHKRGQDIFDSENCPKCGAPLTLKLVETAKCPYCGTYINSGEYDWVLAEITQANDYNLDLSDLTELPPLPRANRAAVLAVYPSFSTYVMEDRASNAFMQILIGLATRNLDALKKFTSDRYFAFLKANLPPLQFVYDRLFTKAVELLGVRIEGQTLTAFVAIQYEYQQVNLSTLAQTLDIPEDHSTECKILVMVRTISDVTKKGSTYAGSCPACGAAVKDSLDVTCKYCGQVFNDSRMDWIVESILSAQEYRALAAQA